MSLKRKLNEKDAPSTKDWHPQDMVKELEQELIPFSKHIHTAYWQIEEFTQVPENISLKTVLLLMALHSMLCRVPIGGNLKLRCFQLWCDTGKVLKEMVNIVTNDKKHHRDQL